VTDAIYRHVTVVAPLAQEYRRLLGFFPPEVKERITQTIEGDPLPPVTSVSGYGEAYFAEAGMEGRRGTGVVRSAARVAEELQRAVQNPAERGQFQVRQGWLLSSVRC